jgi:dolichol-phosphate mannosyltransferase
MTSKDHCIVLTSKKGERRLAKSTLLSIVVAVYNEEAVLEALITRLSNLMSELPTACEVVLVNDGSTDGSLGIMRELVKTDARYRVADLSRNFGHQNAVSAGLQLARGDVIAMIDADLQDPPEAIGEMIKRWADGVDVVYGQRRSRAGESRLKLWTAHLYYALLARIANVDIPRNAGDFRVIDRQVAEAVNRLPERHRFLRGMYAWVGFRQEAFLYDRAPRAAGETKYPLGKMIRLSLDGILSFSMNPLRLLFYFGVVVTSGAFLSGIYLLAHRILYPDALQPGLAGLFVAVLFLFGVNFLFLGIIGEYLGRAYSNSQGRPYVIVRNVIEGSTASGKVEERKATEQEVVKMGKQA